MDKVEATPLDDASIELLARQLKAIDWRPGCLMEQSASALRSLARERRRAREVSRGMAMDVLAQDVTADVLAAQRDAALARAEKAERLLSNADAECDRWMMVCDQIRAERDEAITRGDDWCDQAKKARAERDRLVEAVQALDAAHTLAAREVERLREALEEIERGHTPSQPITAEFDELTWAKMWVGRLRRTAAAALAREGRGDG